MPAPKNVFPDKGKVGTDLPFVITGDALSHVTKVDFGPQVTVKGFKIVSDGAISGDLHIGQTATVGPRDVTVTDASGSDTLAAAFDVIA